VPPYPEEPQAYSDDYYSEPTQAARYGDYDSGSGSRPPEPPTPWYRRPAALVAAGAVGVVLLAGAVYAGITLTSGSSTPSPATTTTAAPATTPAAPSRHHGPGEQPTATVTETAPPPADTGTTTVPPSTETPTTTVAPSTSTATSTVTVTEPPRRGPFERGR
jgi:hypothetical protein